MKKNNFLKAIFGLTIIASFFVGCNSKDTTPPKIFLTGGDPLNWVLNQTFVDPGATADDNVDGNISNSIKADASLVNVNKTGTYLVIYNVEDSEGNKATKTRSVKVYNEASKYVLNYNVERTQQFGSQTPILYTTTFTASTTINRRLDFTNFSNLKIKAYCNVIDTLISIPNQKDTLYAGTDSMKIFNFYGAAGNSFVTKTSAGKTKIQLKYTFETIKPTGVPVNVVTEILTSN